MEAPCANSEVIVSSASFVAKQLGYDKLKGLQVEVILSFLTGKDVFAILPTGYGKSLCFAILPLLLDHLFNFPLPSIVIVVTPLIAIMEDQVRFRNFIFLCMQY